MSPLDITPNSIYSRNSPSPEHGGMSRLECNRFLPSGLERKRVTIGGRKFEFVRISRNKVECSNFTGRKIENGEICRS